MNRRFVACLSALLIIVQVMAAPLASAVARGTADHDCGHGGTVHPWHADDGCAGNTGGHGATDYGSHHPAPAHHCHCVHLVSQTPAVGSLPIAQALHVEVETVTGSLPGPAYRSPIFDFLRPPD